MILKKNLERVRYIHSNNAPLQCPDKYDTYHRKDANLEANYRFQSLFLDLVPGMILHIFCCLQIVIV